MAAISSSPTRTGRRASRSVTIRNTPRQSSPAYLLDDGVKVVGIHPHTWKRARVQRLGEPRTVDPRRTDLLERRIGAAADRDVRVLDGANTRVERRLVQVAHVRRRIDPRHSCPVEPLIARPVLHRHDRQRGADLVLGVEQAGQFAEGHAMADRHWEVRGEALRRPRPGAGPSTSKPFTGLGRSSTTTAIFRFAASSITYATVAM